MICGNPSVTNNLTYCYIARDVELTSPQHLDDVEDLVVRRITEEELYALLTSDSMKQALMTAPLWRYFALGLNKR